MLTFIEGQVGECYCVQQVIPHTLSVLLFIPSCSTTLASKGTAIRRSCHHTPLLRSRSSSCLSLSCAGNYKVFGKVRLDKHSAVLQRSMHTLTASTAASSASLCCLFCSSNCRCLSSCRWRRILSFSACRFAFSALSLDSLTSLLARFSSSRPSIAMNSSKAKSADSNQRNFRNSLPTRSGCSLARRPHVSIQYILKRRSTISQSKTVVITQKCSSR